LSLAPREGSIVGARRMSGEAFDSSYSALPAAKTSITSAPNVSLPMIAPSLVMPVARTRLAIPIEPIEEPEFDVDILGIYGMPLLCATLSNRLSVDSNIRIASHGMDSPLAAVTPRLEVMDSESKLFAKLVRSGNDQFVLQDPEGRAMMVALLGAQVGEVTMVSSAVGQTVEHATVFRRPAGHLPKEHYEVIVSPNVDAVLILAVYLAIVVFALPPLR